MDNMDYENQTPSQTQQHVLPTIAKRPRATAKTAEIGLDGVFTATRDTSPILGTAKAMGDLGISSNKENHKEETFDRVIAEIHCALTTKQRLTAFKRLQHLLQLIPQQKQKHDEDEHALALVNPARILESGLINALSLQLHRNLNRHGSTPVEMELLCYCLYLAFDKCRKQRQELQHCMQQQGTPFVDMLTQAIEIKKQQQQNHHAPQRSALLSDKSSGVPSVLRSVHSLFNIMTSSVLGTGLLLKSRDVGITIIDSLSDPHTPDATRLETLGILKNMTYYDENCSIILVKLPGFLAALTALPNQYHHPLSPKSRNRLLGIVRNLATTAECRTILIRQPAFVGLLARYTAAENNNGFTMQDEQSSRRNILFTLTSLAMDQESSLLLLLHGDGILLRRLLAYLRDFTGVNNDETRKSVVRILRLLAHEASVPLLIHNKELMHQLSDAALRDSCAAVRAEATEAFTRCAALAQTDTNQSSPHSQHYYESVLDALELLVQQQQSRDVSRDVFAQTLREQALLPGNRILLGKRPVLLQTVTQIALERGVSSVTAVRDACCTLRHLSLEESNREYMGQCVPNLLDALLTNLSSFSQGDHHDHVDSVERQDALQTLMNLARCPANAESMARHGCLVATLIQIAGKLDQESGAKTDLKQTILLLVQKL